MEGEVGRITSTESLMGVSNFRIYASRSDGGDCRCERDSDGSRDIGRENDKQRNNSQHVERGSKCFCFLLFSVFHFLRISPPLARTHLENKRKGKVLDRTVHFE